MAPWQEKPKLFPEFQILYPDANAIREATEAMNSGGTVAVMNGSVAAIIGDGNHPNFFNELCHIKGSQRQGRPTAGFYPFELLLGEFPNLPDLTGISPPMKEYLTNPVGFRQKYGPRFDSVTFIRFPVARNLNKYPPAHMIYTNPDGIMFFQNWDPTGTPFMKGLSRKMIFQGMVPAISSLNISGEDPEICNQADAIRFAMEKNIKLFIKAHGNPGKGQSSYPIITIAGGNILLTRAGSLTPDLLITLCSDIMETPLDISTVSPLKVNRFPHNFPPILLEGLNPRQIWIAIMAFLSGRSPLEINRILKKSKFR